MHLMSARSLSLRPLLKFAAEPNKPDSVSLPEVAAQWDANADTWSRVTASGQDAFRKYLLEPMFFSLLGPVKDMDVLDAGSGEGTLCRQLAKRGARVTGLELSPKLLAAAAAQETNNSRGIQYQLGSITDMKAIASESQDRVVSTMVLMDAPDVVSALQEFHRVLRPGGELVFTIKHPMTTVDGLKYRVNDQDQLEMSFDTSYFSKVPFKKVVSFEAPPGETVLPTITSIHYPRTVSDYVNALKTAGFEILQMEEPSASKAAIKDRPYMKPFRKIPFVLMVKAKKPVQFGAVQGNTIELTEFQKNNAVWGGGCDPLHLQHRDIILAAIRQFGIKKLKIIPTWKAPHKDKADGASFEDRVEMVKRTFKGVPEIEVCEIEKELPPPSYSYRTLGSLHPDFETFGAVPGKKIPMIIGEDSDPRDWKDGEKLTRNCVFLIAGRPDLATVAEGKVPFREDPNVVTCRIDVSDRALSSRDLRKRISEGMTLTELNTYVPEAVAEYIFEKKLYGCKGYPPQ